MTKDMSLDRDFETRWKLLSAARDRLGAAQSLEDVIAVVRTAARAICSADGVTFVLCEGEDCHYVDEDAISPLWKGQSFPLATCISGWCMLNGRTAAIEDIYSDSRIPHDVYRKTFVKSLIMVPVGTKIAAIGAYWRERRSFSPREIATIEALAEAVGEAMERPRAA
jgi:GAF domain-containing protein